MEKIKYKAPFIENELYHIYNRTNNREFLFRNDLDRNTFFKFYFRFCSPFMKLFSYSLLPNHFHVLVKIKSYQQIGMILHSIPFNDLCKTEKRFIKFECGIHELIDNAFKRFFITYMMYYNKAHNRKGNLIHRPFKHASVAKDEHLTQAIIYINANAIKHKLESNLLAYKWSSYPTLLSDKPSRLCRKEIFEWFGGREQFIRAMEEQTLYYYQTSTVVRDDY